MARKNVPAECAVLLARHGLTPKQFESTGLEWPALQEICAHHRAAASELQTAATYISGRLQHVPGVHSLKVRIKDPEHLVAKIVRKKLEKPERTFSVESYEQEVTDLIGIRALHLFKDEWRDIHAFVQATWELHEHPTAYVREGDKLTEAFEAAGCEVKEHPFGYRSVHYIVKTQPAKRVHRAELQVRTIFEEGWSEIDHRVRYPRHSEDAYLADFLAIFNRLAGSADEMGTFIKLLVVQFEEQREAVAERDRRISERERELKSTVAALAINEAEKKNLQKQIEELRRTSQAGTFLRGITGVAEYAGIPGAGSTGVGFQFSHTCLSCGKSYSPRFGYIDMGTCEECKKAPSQIIFK